MYKIYRYNMTLREYLNNSELNYLTRTLLFGQLMEAIVYLFEQRISHRDIKSDNVLLNLDNNGIYFLIFNLMTF